jgi:hypothetical protein
MGVVLELPAPGVQDPGEPRKVCPNEALVCGQPLEGRCRRLKQGVVREAWMRRMKGRRVAGTVKVRRTWGPGSCLARWYWSHCWVVCC